MTMGNKFPWRQALALFLVFLVCTCLWAEAEQTALAEKVIRLHVLANSDSQADQALKLRVRDRVLAGARPLLASSPSLPPWPGRRSCGRGTITQWT